MRPAPTPRWSPTPSEGGEARAPDGSPVELFARLSGEPAAGYVDGLLQPASRVLDLGCGAGRLAVALAARGHRVTGVDQSSAMLARVPALEGVETVEAGIEDLDLGCRFDAVLLASYLINTPDDGQRDAFLASATRHGDRLVMQRHDPEWLATVDDEEGDDGLVRCRVRVVRRVGPVVTFEATHTIAGDSWHQTVTARILDDDDLTAVLAGHGLAVRRWLDPFHTWAEVIPL